MRGSKKDIERDKLTCNDVCHKISGHGYEIVSELESTQEEAEQEFPAHVAACL